MDKNFWSKLKKPIMVLAPMANVTDASFRHIIAKYGKPDVMWTEFVSADGLCSKGRDKLLVDFWYENSERPIVAQVFGANPENMFKAAELIRKLKFDGVDINMGCPDRAVLKQGAGGALIKNQTLAKELIKAAQEGAKGLPISVKTRIGVSKPMLEEWFGFLAIQKLAAITVHLRTVKEQSLVSAHWELMPEIVKIIKHHCEERSDVAILDKIATRLPKLTLGKKAVARDGKTGCSLILGNGDVMSINEAKEKCAQTGADGVMIGRGIFGNPWLFSSSPRIGEVRRGRDKAFESTTPSPSYSRRGIQTVAEKLHVMVEHSKLFEKKFTKLKIGGKRFEVMKKHYKAYVNNFDGAKELRVELMEAENAKEVERIVRKYLK